MDPITWNEMRESLVALHERLTAARNRASGDVVMPNRGQNAMSIYSDAFSGLYMQVRDNLNVLEKLLRRIDASVPEMPVRPLDAVLADIEAEGHEFEIKTNYGGSGKVRIASRLRDARFDNHGEWNDEKQARYAAWQAEAEEGDVWMEGDLVVVAEKRLADIRKLHAEKLDPIFLGAAGANISDTATHILAGHILAGVGMVHIEGGQEGRYAVGELSREGDSTRWYVIEYREANAPSLVFEFMHREEAESCRDALNTGAFAPLMCPDSEHEERMRQDRDAAAEDIRREALASEEGS